MHTAEITKSESNILNEQNILAKAENFRSQQTMSDVIFMIPEIKLECSLAALNSVLKVLR